MNATTTVTLIATTMLLTNADSDTPSTSRPVTAAVEITAGRFTTPVPTTVPETKSVTGVPQAPRRAMGTSSPKSCKKLVTYPDHPTATVEAAMPYSSTNSTPMIQAASSPSDAYEYEYADPDTGIADASSAYDNATSAHNVPVMMNETMIAGPANCAAARPVSTKIPVPMMQPMPSSTRLSAPSDFLS